MLCELQFAFVALLIIATVSTRNQQIYFEDHLPLYRSCLTNKNRDGWCRNIQHCPKKSLTGADKPPKLCGFADDKTPVICCPLSTNLLSTNGTNPYTILKVVEAPPINFGECGLNGNRPSLFRKERAADHGNIQKPNPIFTHFQGDKEGTENNRQTQGLLLEKDYPPFEVELQISKGEDALWKSWPWMALFGRNTENGIDYFCGGALINERYVITAAHCLHKPIGPFFIRLGEHDYASTRDSGNPFNVQVEDIIIYPDYLERHGYHDLALIKLAHNVFIKHFQSHVSPICLPWGNLRNADLVGHYVTATGWGAKFYGGPTSPILQEVDIEVFDSSDCQNSYWSLKNFRSKYPRGLNVDNIVCAGDKEGGKDACQKDSGGPLVHFDRHDWRWTLAGIVSAGYRCGERGYPGLYAPIRNLEHLQWIKDVAFAPNSHK